MARRVTIPTHVLKTKLSHSALALWVQLAQRSTPKKPMVTLNLQILAEALGRSKRTVSRLIIELEAAGLLMRGGVIDRHHRIGELIWVMKTKPVIKPVITPTTDLLDLIPPELHAQAIQIVKECNHAAEFETRINWLLRDHATARQGDNVFG